MHIQKGKRNKQMRKKTMGNLENPTMRVSNSFTKGRLTSLFLHKRKPLFAFSPLYSLFFLLLSLFHSSFFFKKKPHLALCLLLLKTANPLNTFPSSFYSHGFGVSVLPNVDWTQEAVWEINNYCHRSPARPYMKREKV